MLQVIRTELVKYLDALASPALLMRSSSRTLMKTLTFGNLHPQHTHEIASPFHRSNSMEGLACLKALRLSSKNRC